jgi:hypothetical protein
MQSFKSKLHNINRRGNQYPQPDSGIFLAGPFKKKSAYSLQVKRVHVSTTMWKNLEELLKCSERSDRITSDTKIFEYDKFAGPWFKRKFKSNDGNQL